MRAVIGWYAKEVARNDYDHPIYAPIDILECGHEKHMPFDYRLIDHLKTAMQTAGLRPVGKRRCMRCSTAPGAIRCGEIMGEGVSMGPNEAQPTTVKPNKTRHS
jgi:hypothetical protein